MSASRVSVGIVLLVACVLHCPTRAADAAADDDWTRIHERRMQA